MVSWRHLLHLVRENWLQESILTTNVYGSSNSGPFYLSTTNLKLHHIPVTLDMVVEVITDLDSPKVSDPDCVRMVVQKKVILDFHADKHIFL